MSTNPDGNCKCLECGRAFWGDSPDADTCCDCLVEIACIAGSFDGADHQQWGGKRPHPEMWKGPGFDLSQSCPKDVWDYPAAQDAYCNAFLFGFDAAARGDLGAASRGPCAQCGLHPRATGESCCAGCLSGTTYVDDYDGDV